MMRLFSIKELERFSGIKAHTIRIWEKRYSIFNPQRTDGNIRTYTISDVALLLNISLLTEYGFKISRLLELQPHELQLRIASLRLAEARRSQHINRLIVHMFTQNIEEFEGVLDECMISWGIGDTIRMIIIPFLEKVNLLSYKDSSAEAHIVVTSVRRKLILGIEKTAHPDKNAKTALLFLPKGEHYDLLLLYLCYELKNCGIKVLYLGTNISVSNLASIVCTTSPDFVYSYIATRLNFPLVEYAVFFRQHLPSLCLFVAYADDSNKIDCKDTFPNVRFFYYNRLRQIAATEFSDETASP